MSKMFRNSGESLHKVSADTGDEPHAVQRLSRRPCFVDGAGRAVVATTCMFVAGISLPDLQLMTVPRLLDCSDLQAQVLQPAHPGGNGDASGRIGSGQNGQPPGLAACALASARGHAEVFIPLFARKVPTEDPPELVPTAAKEAMTPGRLSKILWHVISNSMPQAPSPTRLL